MDDEFVIAAQMAMEGLSKAAVPGAYWVEFLPLLRYLPNWFPGMSFRKLVDEYLPYVSSMREDPYNHVKAAMVGRFIDPTFATIFNLYTFARALVQRLFPSPKS